MYEPTLERVGGSLLVRRGYPRCATTPHATPTERGDAFGFALRRGEADTSHHTPAQPLTLPLTSHAAPLSRRGHHPKP